MRLTTISAFGVGVGVVMAGADMQIDFPGFLRAPRAEQNLQVSTTTELILHLRLTFFPDIQRRSRRR